MRSILLLLTIIFIASCQPARQEQQASSATIDTAGMSDSARIIATTAAKLNIQLDNMREIDTTGSIAYMLQMGEAKGRDGGSYDRSTSYKDMPPNQCWNIVFYNSRTGGYHLLSDRKMIVWDFDMEHSEINAKLPFIFYRITVNDHNGDKLFTYDDPQHLFVTDKQGRNLRQLSPNGYHMIAWRYIQASGKIIMSLRRDSDGDKEFDQEDEITSFETSLHPGTQPREVFPQDFKNSLKLLYDRDWKKIKK